jgi:very-short-patch-repair endonuclease
VADQTLGALAVGALLVVCWWWAERQATQRHQVAVEAYHAAFERHRNITDVQQEHEQALNAYSHRTMPDYYARYMAPVLSRRTLKPQPIPGTEPKPPTGRSEHAFRTCLEQHFGEHHILTGFRVPVDEPQSSVQWYYPDFVYSDSSGLCIDIEIDEPYALHSRQATHYRGKDDRRNAFFLRHQWAVVRFSEEQVVRYPHLCCQELAALIFYLNGRSYAARLYVDRLPRCPQWDWMEARFMAARWARQEYWSEPTAVAEEG